MPNFGELLRRLRGERSQREVASELRMPVTTLSSLENQATVPRGPVLKRLAEYYGVPISYFYPAPSTPMKSSESAKEWLLSLRGSANMKETVATHAPIDFPDEVKSRVAEAIRKRKHAEAPNDN
jgi:transcriptional regulator with XRE-family HTH domain